MVRTKIRPQNPDAKMKSYYRTYQEFTWADPANELPDYDPQKTNIVNFAVDRWALDPDMKRQYAVIFEKGGQVENRLLRGPQATVLQVGEPLGIQGIYCGGPPPDNASCVRRGLRCHGGMRADGSDLLQCVSHARI